MNRPLRCRIICSLRKAGIIRDRDRFGRVLWRCERCLATWSFYRVPTSKLEPVLLTILAVLVLIGALR